MRFSTILLASSILVAACSDDPKRNGSDATDTDSDVSSDSSVADSSADTSTPDAVETQDAPDTTPADIADTTPDSDTRPLDVTQDDGGGDADDTGDAQVVGAYIEHCGSLFAARIVERQIDMRSTFAKDCDAPLRDAVGRLKQNGKELCKAGESANACRERLYRTPPDVDDLDQACWSNTPPDGCMHGSFLPRCADGTDDCVEDEVVCWDGMRPMIYAEAATAGPSPSDVWWFHMGGEGGPCWGAQCWGNYRFGEPEFRFAMSSLHPDGPSNAATRPGGVLSGDAALPYSRVNRVRFERCTDAASDAVESVPVADGVPAEYAARYPGVPIATGISQSQVWHRGFDTWRATFRAMTTNVGRDRDGDGTPDMPSLADARLVIISGSSDASMWVTFAADRLAEEIRAIAGNDVEVRMAVDGMFPPMLDNEARYHPSSPEGFDMFDMPYSETGLCLLDDNGDGVSNEACSDQAFEVGGMARNGYDRRGLLRDASCDAMHGAGAPQCYDRNHVLLHHVGVPVLVLADQEDNTVSDGPPTYAEDYSYHWADPAAYRKRIADAGWDVVQRWSTSAREEGAGAPGDFVLILPKTRREGEPWGRATHVRFGDDGDLAKTMTLCKSDGSKVATASYNQMIAGWLTDALPQTFAIEDARHPLPNGDVWVTGSSCRAPE